MTNAIVAANRLGMIISGSAIFEDVSLTCEAGAVTALVGPSGCGKTTLLQCLGLLHTPTRGTVEVDGYDTASWSERKKRRFWRESAAFVQQDYGVVDDETVEFNVTMKLNLFGQHARTTSAAVRQALERAGLEGRENELASHLSGGEKQRLALARAIYKQARVIFADEPTASLDRGNRQRVTDLFRDLSDAGVAVVIATHDERLADLSDVTYDLGKERV